MIFLDTSAIYALADRADPRHQHAKARFQALLDAGENSRSSGLTGRGTTRPFAVSPRPCGATALAFDADFEAEGFRVF